MCWKRINEHIEGCPANVVSAVKNQYATSLMGHYLSGDLIGHESLFVGECADSSDGCSVVNDSVFRKWIIAEIKKCGRPEGLRNLMAFSMIKYAPEMGKRIGRKFKR